MRNPDWMRTLDEVDLAIDRCLTALDRYEAKFFELLESSSAAGSGSRPLEIEPERVPPVPTHDDIDELIAEQEAVWARWQERLARVLNTSRPNP